MKRKILVPLMAALALTLLISGVSQAAIINLSDANSTLQINTSSSIGASGWVVDGVPQLFQQEWFIGFGAGNQQSVSNFPTVVTAPPPSNFADITYVSAGLWTLDTTYTLSGGAAGSRRSDLVQQATFNNISGAAQQLRLYLYTDLDLTGSLLDNGVNIIANHHVVQTDAATIADTVMGPDANRVEANFFANTLNSLGLGASAPAYALNNVTSAGPGDDTWAVEWLVTVAPGSSFQLSLDTFVTPVPVPPTAILLGTGLLGLLGFRFRKNRA